MKSLRERLREGETVYGTWCMLPSSFVIDAVASSGLDFVIIDMEHGAMSFQTAEEMVRAAEANGCHAVLRTDGGSEKTILHALEVGAEAVLVPHVSTPEEAERIVKAARYFPDGDRGLSPYTRSHGYSHVGLEESLARANERVVTGVLLEGQEALDNLDAILEVEGLDIVYLGVYDICQVMGIPGQLDHPDLIETLESCASRIRSKNVAAGSFARDIQMVKLFKRVGFQFIGYMCDAAALVEYFKDASGAMQEQ